jgi:hypothetical protein
MALYYTKQLIDTIRKDCGICGIIPSCYTKHNLLLQALNITNRLYNHQKKNNIQAQTLINFIIFLDIKLQINIV